MKKVIGIGGIFFKSKDPKALSAWYDKHLGLTNPGWGALLNPDEIKQHFPDGYQLWSPFKEDTTYFAPSSQSFMLNFIVADLHALLAELRNEGVEVMEKVEESEFGKFGWCIDPDGNKIELWEPAKKV